MFPVRTAARPSIHCLGRLDDEATDNPLVGVFGPIGFGAAPIRRSGTDAPYHRALAERRALPRRAPGRTRPTLRHYQEHRPASGASGEIEWG
jgi:hypothetical protein